MHSLKTLFSFFFSSSELFQILSQSML